MKATVFSFAVQASVFVILSIIATELINDRLHLFIAGMFGYMISDYVGNYISKKLT